MKIAKFRNFCHFRCQFETNFIRKTAMISSQNTSGQRIRTLNTPNQKVCQNLDRSSIKLRKLEKFRFFVVFGDNLRLFSIHKLKQTLRKNLLDNNLFRC